MDMAILSNHIKNSCYAFYHDVELFGNERNCRENVEFACDIGGLGGDRCNCNSRKTILTSDLM